MKKSDRKLTLHQETLRNLTNQEIKLVAGGATLNGTCPADTCLTCHVPSICEIC